MDALRLFVFERPVDFPVTSFDPFDRLPGGLVGRLDRRVPFGLSCYARRVVVRERQVDCPVTLFDPFDRLLGGLVGRLDRRVPFGLSCFARKVVVPSRQIRRCFFGGYLLWCSVFALGKFCFGLPSFAGCGYPSPVASPPREQAQDRRSEQTRTRR